MFCRSYRDLGAFRRNFH